MHEGVPTRVLGLRQLDMAKVESSNRARVQHAARDEDAMPDACIIGAGAGGSVLAAKLAEAGWSVVVLEAGPFWVPERDWASDEKAQGKLYWSDPRVTGGDDPIELGANVTGKGVGGSTVHFTMVKLRMHASDFRARSKEGVGDDWPITYQDLAPYYDEVERDLGVAGPSHFPWGEFRGPYAQRPHPLSTQARIFAEGCERLGIRVAPSPLATLSSPQDGRPPCTYRGFCVVGCKPNAKSSALVTHIPRAVAAGALIKDRCMVARLNLTDGRVASATYLHEGRRYEQRARLFIVAGYAIETPRLLLNSADEQHPDGLANSSGLVGKRLMTHSSHRVYGRFDRMARQYKAPPGIALTQDYYATPADSAYVRGFTIETGGALPIAFAKMIAQSTGAWGWELRRIMQDYNHYAGAAMNGECLPYEHNEVRLASERDQHGIPVAHVRFSWGDNEKRMIDHGYAALESIYAAAGGRNLVRAADTAHLMGTCRMGDDPQASVVDRWCRTWDVPNLFICDGSIFVTSSAANPSLTIEALAARLGDHLVARRE